MSNGTTYPPVGFHFRVEFFLQGATPSTEIHFQEVGGLNKEMTTEEFIEGGENRFVYRFPKGTKYPNLVLKRGMVTDSKLMDWVRDAIDHFDFRPANVTVTLLNPQHEPLVKWDLMNCWPVKWSTNDLKAQENAVVIEVLELTYQVYRQQKV
ncbi:MAG TPA: phage tail protein [Phnomibacter sp.]|nr:phage tail protein [Phnomibacter sp.]